MAGRKELHGRVRRVEPLQPHSIRFGNFIPKGSGYSPFKDCVPKTVPGIWLLESESLNGEYLDPLGFGSATRAPIWRLCFVSVFFEAPLEALEFRDAA